MLLQIVSIKYRTTAFAAAIFLFVAAVSSADDQQRTTPFVAGFDRFGRHDAISKSLAGKLLATELSCTACHATDDGSLAPKKGPNLNGVGNRIQPAWIRRYLRSPQEVKPGTTMPHVLSGAPEGSRKEVADALTAFLSHQKTPFPIFKATGANPVPHEFWNKGDADAGERLYHRIGCIACHEPSASFETGVADESTLDKLLKELSPDELAEMGLTNAARLVNSIPHGDIETKYTRQSLTHFLLNPLMVRPDGRMPDFKLQPMEAADITAYLLRDAPKPKQPVSADAKEIAAGRRWFVELRCGKCHDVQDDVQDDALGDVRGMAARALADIDPSGIKSCIGDSTTGLPHYLLDASQRKAIAALLKSKGADNHVHEQVDLQLLQLNCYACHERSKRGGVGRNRRQYFETERHVDLGDEGRLPPSLSGVGRKLQTAWMAKVIQGDAIIRPHMSARMPRFPQAAQATFPKLFAAADAKAITQQPFVFEQQVGFADAGRELFNIGCVQCHAVNGESLPGVVGVDVLGVSTRLHPAWFREFLMNPIQVKAGTRMPTFFPKGNSSNPDVLGGDVDQQIAALWTYIRDIEKHPLPRKIVAARAADFELRPVDRPIIQRTFMKDAGLHAIAVGFPAQVHFAFDAENAHIAQAWRGKFLDAHGTWFDRFAPLAVPLGNDVLAFPPMPTFADLSNAEQTWPDESRTGSKFEGYQLDSDGVPTFLYRVNAWRIEDRISPMENGLVRKVTVHAVGPKPKNPLWFMANAGEKLSKLPGNAYSRDDGFTVTIVGDIGTDAIRESNGRSEWIIQLPHQTKTELELNYQWPSKTK